MNDNLMFNEYYRVQAFGTSVHVVLFVKCDIVVACDDYLVLRRIYFQPLIEAFYDLEGAIVAKKH